MRLLRKVVAGILVTALVLAAIAATIGYVTVRRAFPQINGTLQVAGLHEPVEIVRDKWGVPHIYAQNEHDVFFAQGYVHAQDRLWQLELSRRVGAGRLSEVLGEAALENDRFLRTIGLYRAAQADYETLPAEVIDVLQAYADGVNASISAHHDRLPLEFMLLGFAPEPWTPVDSLAWGKVMCLSLGGSWEHELLWAQLLNSLGEDRVLELAPGYPDQGPFIIPSEAKSYAQLDLSLLETASAVRDLLGGGNSHLGSNNWVVDGTMTASGRPMLANDPHLGIQMPSIWYEVHLVAGDLDVVGASFPGAPGVIIGHNRDIAWGVTNAGPDVQDLYIERINPDNPYQYQYDGRWEDMTVLREKIAVKGRDRPEQLEVRLTRHGPIMNEVGCDSEETMSLRWTALEGGQLFRSVYMLDTARNWEEFREALRYWQAPSQNFVYADVDGNIGYQLPGHIPVRPKGEGLVPVPGWTSEYEWAGYIRFDELPYVYNPRTHFVVTANNKVVPDSYPYFISREWAEPYRAQRITNLLQAGAGWTIEGFRDIQADTYSATGERLAALLLNVGPSNWLEKRAFRFLEEWDSRLTADSGAGGITEVLLWRLLVNTFGDEVARAGLDEDDFVGFASALLTLLDDPTSPWFDDVRTPEVESQHDILQTSLQETTDFWARRYGDLVGNKDEQWAWGKIHTATFEHVLGAVSPLHLLFNRGPVAVGGSGNTVCACGYEYGDFGVSSLPSYRQIIDVGEWQNSRSQHTTGQSGQPLHKHYADMIDAWRKVEHHRMLYEREDILADKEGTLVLQPS